VGGFILIDAAGMDEALEIAIHFTGALNFGKAQANPRRCPAKKIEPWNPLVGV
jgi:hypothetical protein